jgi:hypothetical protein
MVTREGHDVKVAEVVTVALPLLTWMDFNVYIGSATLQVGSAREWPMSR